MTDMEVLEHASMFNQYRGGYYGNTCEYFAGDFMPPVFQMSAAGGLDVVAFENGKGNFIFTTVGVGVCPPGKHYPPFEIVAIANKNDEAIARAVVSIAVGGQTGTPHFEPHHKFRFADDGEPSRFFFLDGGVFGFGWNARRLIAVPVDQLEYDALLPRGDLKDGEVPQVPVILQLAPAVEEWRDLPERLVSRW